MHTMFLKKKIVLKTKKQYLYLKILKNNFVQVNMGIPKFSPQAVFYNFPKNQLYYKIKILDIVYNMSIVSLGNPHCIILVKNLKNFPVYEIGSKLSTHKSFSQGVNVGFVEIVNSEKIYLRVYERHVGETEACGSGACAAVAVGIRNLLLGNIVEVILPGGILKIFWKGNKNFLYMTGPATHVYDGILSY